MPGYTIQSRGTARISPTPRRTGSSPKQEIRWLWSVIPTKLARNPRARESPINLPHYSARWNKRPATYDRVQPIPTQSSRSTAQTSSTSYPKASHTHRQRLKRPQQHPSLASRITGRKSSSTVTALQRHYHNRPQYLSIWLMTLNWAIPL
jgi:hypothetical protein